MVIVLCSHCKVRPATLLCDAPIGRKNYIGHPPRHLMEKAKNWNYAFVKVEMSEVITCDRPICDKCATRVAEEIDLCPNCMERIKKKRS